jgi:hypothetical protein
VTPGGPICTYWFDSVDSHASSMRFGRFSMGPMPSCQW